jgi:exopolysaccharide production protein ExoZ
VRTVYTSIQALRFAAAAMVVLAHCASGYFLPGVAGVDIFFVVSGFIITTVMRGRTIVDFALDRFTRIYPIYWLCLLPFAWVDWDRDIMHLVTSVTLWPVFDQARLPFLVVGWTLCFELLFYLGAALVLWRRAMLWVLAFTYAASFVIGLLTESQLARFVGNPMVLEFMFGVLIALLPRTQKPRLGGVAMVTGLLAIPLLASPDFGSPLGQLIEFSSRPLQWGIPAALIVWGALQFELMLKGKMWKAVAFGGNASYSIYLTHPLGLLLLAPTNPYLKLLLMPPVLLALGAVAHLSIEKPLLNTTRRIIGRRNSRQARVSNTGVQNVA